MEIKDIQRIDKDRMYEYYDKWPDFARQSYKKESSDPKFSDPEFSNIDHIVFGGMGGSGTIGDIISSILSKKDIHVSVIKGYLLPKTVDENTVIVLTSISGNTDETISLLNDALKTKAKIIVFSSGGKIQGISEKNNVSYYKIGKNHSPRVSLLGFLYSILKILKQILPIDESEITESLEKLEDYRKKISSLNLTDSNPFNNIKIACKKRTEPRYYINNFEIDLIFEFADIYKDFFSFLLHTGLRCTDVFKLHLHST